MRSNLPKGVHRVRRKVKGGTRFHFYAWRGGPKFWISDCHTPTDPEFLRAYVEATERPKANKYMTPRLVDDFLSSTAMPKAERSRQDLQKWALRFADHFKDADAVIFEERGSRGEVNKWRSQWKHSPKQHDVAGTHAARILNWAVEEGKLTEHHCHKLHRLYTVDRSEIVWASSDLEAMKNLAPEWVWRVLCVACETGLRPGDLGPVDVHRTAPVSAQIHQCQPILCRQGGPLSSEICDAMVDFGRNPEGTRRKLPPTREFSLPIRRSLRSNSSRWTQFSPAPVRFGERQQALAVVEK